MGQYFDNNINFNHQHISNDITVEEIQLLERLNIIIPFIQNLRIQILTSNEIAEFIGITTDSYYRLLDRFFNVFCNPDKYWLNHRYYAVSSNRDNNIQHINEEDRMSRLADIIKKLPCDEKIIVRLYFCDNLTMSEIAAVLDTSITTINRYYTQTMIRIWHFMSK